MNMLTSWLAWYETFNWWEKYFFTPLVLFVLVDILVAIVLMIVERADHIYNNRNTRPEDMLKMFAWPFGLIIYIPYAMVEWPAQMLAKYRENRKKKKLHITKVS